MCMSVFVSKCVSLCECACVHVYVLCKLPSFYFLWILSSYVEDFTAKNVPTCCRFNAQKTGGSWCCFQS